MIYRLSHRLSATLFAVVALTSLAAAPVSAVVCPADVTGNNVVDTPDLDFLNACWGPVSPASFCAVVDFDVDGAIGTSDLLFVLSTWGPCPSAPCPWDLNEDDQVDSTDQDMLLACWGPVNAGSVCAGADFDDIGAVDVFDLLDVLNNWGSCP